MWVTQKEAHKTSVSGTEATGCLLRAVHHFFMQTDILVNGRSYVKKISEPVLLLLFPSNIPSKGEGRTALPSLSVRLTPSRLIPRPFVRRLCPAKPAFPPSLSPLSCPFTVAPAWLPVSLISSDTLHSPTPRPGYALYSCMISKERGLSGRKLHKCMKSVDKASNPRRLAAGDDVQVGAKETLLHSGG